MQRIGQVHARIGEVYGKMNEGQTADVFETLSQSFKKIHTSCSVLKKSAVKDHAKFFQFYKYELNSIEELLQKCMERKSELVQTEKRLRQKKESLYSQQLVAKWKIDPNCKITIDVLLKNKAVALREMLPDETKECNHLRIVYGYYCNKVKEEFMRTSKNDETDIKAHCLQMAKSNCNIFEDVFIFI